LIYQHLDSFYSYFLILGFIKFYQNWCGHCKRMKPDWDKLADELNSDHALIADVDCGKEVDVCDMTNLLGLYLFVFLFVIHSYY